MQTDDTGLIAVVARRRDDLAAHTADGHGSKLALGCFEFDLFHTIKLIQCSTAQHMGECFITREEQAAVRRHMIETCGTFFCAAEAHHEAISTG